MTKNGLKKMMGVLEGAVGRLYPEHSISTWADLLEKISDKEGLEAAKEIARVWTYNGLPSLGIIFKALGYIPGVGYSSENRFSTGDFSRMSFELPEREE